ncbi:MAG: hypothetical protein GXO49_04670 [Chlorobi bacterium]|nr:hypothetical protein [Chlorobiota bacterium]
MTLVEAFTIITNANIKIYPVYQKDTFGKYKKGNWYLVVKGTDFMIKYDKPVGFGTTLSTDDENYVNALYKTIFYYAEKVKNENTK